MKTLYWLTKAVTVFLILLATPTTNPALTQAQTVEEVQSTPRSNKLFNVKRQSGSCPKTVGVWAISFGYRQEIYYAETIVIADTLAIAEPAQLASADKTENKRFVEYQARLKKPYASCVGQASSPEDPHYRFRFLNGKVYFRVDISDIPEGFGAGITEYKIIGLRPYIIWIFSD